MSVRPLIIPKLKEENAKKNDKKPTRDYIHESEFDASVFLLPIATPHAMLNRVCLYPFLSRGISHSLACVACVACLLACL
jgi:hypothetical protein